MAHFRSHALVCVDPECLEKGAREILGILHKELATRGLQAEVQVLETPRLGGCAHGPEMMVYPDGVYYARLTAADMPYLVEEHFLKGRIVSRLQAPAPLREDEELGPPQAKEVRVVLRNCGEIAPENIEDYIAEDGYQALAKVLTQLTPEQVIAELTASGLRGRGGAGFPTGRKWALARQSAATPKYLICNADEGDPGAFMNRRVLEGDPHSVLEGMLIAAYAIGAKHGYIYCRAEYPLAVKTLRIAIQQARAFGLLGPRILDTDFEFDLEVRVGAGAFVCGEETALIASIEGRRGEPRTRPPFPAVQGVWGQPTNNNNVETYANVPQIILHGAAWFASMGTEKSKGTKTFAVAGDVKRTGLIEVPLGITLREVVYDVGGGIKDGKAFKAVQIGGPMGGCLPLEYLDRQIDYESLSAAGAMMGSGGMIVMDEEKCMVDIARFFMEFTQDESCGKCVPCRVGTRRILEVLERICGGQGQPSDLPLLEKLCDEVRSASLCGLGQGAPNPVISTLKHFRAEYEAHIYEKRCPAGVCQKLVRAPCVNTCPAGVDSPAYLALIAQGRYAEGLAIHREANPFALICGRVCPAFCERRCKRSAIDGALSIRMVKRFMADQFYSENWTPERLAPPQYKRVAVVGAGPAGLTAALRLTQQGFQVTVFEKMTQPGGMMTYGIPAYRLPREPLFAEIEHIRRAGVDIRCNQALGRHFTIPSLKAEGYDAILLALGAHKGRRLGIPGDDLSGMYSGVQFLRDIAMGQLPTLRGKRVVVVGGGDVAIDSARSSWRLGAAEVHIVYRREQEDMPAHTEEIAAAQEEGLQFHFLTNPIAVLGPERVTGVRLQRQVLTEFDNTGRRIPQPEHGSEFDLPADVIIPAIGQTTDFDWMTDDVIQTVRVSTFKTTRGLETTLPGVFAAGDAVLGPATVINAVAQGNQAAVAIEAWLTTGAVGRTVYQPARHTVAQKFNILDSANVARHQPAVLPLSERQLAGFAEVERGFEEETAQAEARRCLRCDLDWLQRTGQPLPE